MRLGEQEAKCICPLAWFDAYEFSCRRLGLPMSGGSAFFRWRSGSKVVRADFVPAARKFLERAGIDYARFNGISLRKGGATSMAEAGASNLAIMRAGRWRSWCFTRYVETATSLLLQEQKAMGLL